MKNSAVILLLIALVLPVVITSTIEHRNSVEAVTQQLKNNHSTSSIFPAVAVKGTQGLSSISEKNNRLVGNAPDIMFAKAMLERQAEVEQMAKIVLVHGESPAIKQIASELLAKDNTANSLIETWLTVYHPDMLAQP